MSLLAPHTLAYDPWAWAIWGREALHFDLNTVSGPAWKPLPVMLDSVYALAGERQPDLWLLTARAGCILTLVFAFRLARRLGGVVAGVVAVTWIVFAVRHGFLFGWLTFFGSGWSEGLLACFALAAVDRHLAG